RLGEFGIQPRMVKAPVHEGEAPRQGEEGHTMVYSAVRERDRQRPKEPEQDVRALVSTRAVISLDDRRYVFDGPRATIGRSKSAECVLANPNVSRRHAELRRSDSGDWQIVDLGSTNGIKVNGGRVSSTRPTPGDPAAPPGPPPKPGRLGDGGPPPLPLGPRAETPPMAIWLQARTVRC